MHKVTFAYVYKIIFANSRNKLRNIFRVATLIIVALKSLKRPQIALKSL